MKQVIPWIQQEDSGFQKNACNENKYNQEIFNNNKHNIWRIMSIKNSIYDVAFKHGTIFFIILKKYKIEKLNTKGFRSVIEWIQNFLPITPWRKYQLFKLTMDQPENKIIEVICGRRDQCTITKASRKINKGA